MEISKPNVEALFEPDVLEEIVQGTVKQSVAMQLFRRLPNMSTDVMKMRVLDSLPISYWVNEGANNGRKGLTKMAWDRKYIIAEEIAVVLPIKENVLNDASIDIWSEVKPRITEAFAKKFDQAVFSGIDKPDGFRADLLTSITNAGSFITQGAGDNLYSVIDKAMAKVEESDYEPNGLVGGLSLKSKFRNMLDTTGQPLNTTEIGSLSRYYVSNGAWDKTKALMIVGDFSQAVYSIRQDVTYKLLTEGVIQDPDTGNILYNLGQDDMVALRCVMRVGWEIPNPINAEAPDEATRFPFAAIKATGDAGITTQNVTFTVGDGASVSEELYEGASVKVAGLKIKTDSTGKAVFKLQEGIYDYTVSLEGYNTVKGSVKVGAGAVNEKVVLKEKV